MADLELCLFSYAGLKEETAESFVMEMQYAIEHKINMEYARVSKDALISRCRSRALGRFVLQSQSPVIVMIDHDIMWRPGDVCKLAAAAVERNAILGGLYCKRAFNDGWASRLAPGVQGADFGKDFSTFLPADGVATGFMAIPRTVATTMLEKLCIAGDEFKKQLEDAATKKDWLRLELLYGLSIGYVHEGSSGGSSEYWDFFRCFRRPVELVPGRYEYLSEDWAFAERAKACGFKTEISTGPLLIHWGDHGYHVKDGEYKKHGSPSNAE